ncbi:alcohol dehydrogenase catalytic domain-containing protein [Lentilactobacillus sunkii]|uniref:Alcohol dehydrogenase GroES domain-containing protein n=1 Tax=Lentilactobacillus sunkii DSM 19904 TaxID=1423808 RepID=A0A0R1L0T0_9LACO|nr:zinc-binding dehydrogenase [Lentilactobacillus sunkii]KRK89419.1 alcohol dehydrogenase GroES domain-containing protein [Lentilactobacillus sunkii DSM 19904]
MKAVVLRHPGGPTALSYEDVPMPEIKDGWTLLKVKGFGINRSEIFTRNGWSPSVKLPRILGIECVGEVVETTDPKRLQKGQIVVSVMGGMGRAFNGSYAEYTLLPNNHIYSVDTQLDVQDLAAVPETYGTAYGSLLKLRLDDADSLLIRGATSGVGVAAGKLARAMAPSIKLVGSTRHLEKADELKKVGFDEVVLDKDNQLQTDKKYDRILELVGALSLPNSMQFIKNEGITCVTGELGGVWDLTHFEPISQLNGGYLTSFESGALNQQKFDDLFDIINDNQIDVAPTKTFDLKHTADAQAYLDSHDSFGKAVVIL